jgi:hypothetical protein
MVKMAEDCDISQAKKSSYYNILKVFVKYKSKIIKKNQQDVVIQITSTERGQLIFMMKSEEGNNKVGQLL